MPKKIDFADQIRKQLHAKMLRLVECPKCGERFGVSRERLNTGKLCCPVGCKLQTKKDKER